jgi:phage terminase small subunit
MTKKSEIDHHHIIAEDRAAELVKEGRIKGERRSKRLRFSIFAQSFMDIASSETYLNVRKSALKAGYKESYANTGAYKLLDNVYVRKEIERLKKESAGDPLIASATEVLRTLTAFIRVLPNRLFDPETGDFIHPGKMTDEVAQAVAGFESIERIIQNGDDQPTRELRTKLKLVDRKSAAEILAKYWGLFDRDNKQKTGPPQALVAFPVGEMSLEDWQEAALAILRKQDEEPSLMHIRQGLNRVEPL